MVDVNMEQQLGKDAALVFLHILNQRSKGRRIPNQMPKPLRTSLMRGKLDYNYNEALDSSSSKSRSSSGSTRMSGELEQTFIAVVVQLMYDFCANFVSSCRIILVNNSL